MVSLPLSRQDTAVTKENQIFDPIKVIIISTYISLWVVHYMLVHASGHSRYNDGSKEKLSPAFVLLLTEFTKLCICATIFVAQKFMSKTESNSGVIHARTFEIGPVVTLFKQYLPVAFFYAVANNLMINNLQHFDPTLYLILSSTRLIMTAIVMRMHMGKSISRMKQISLLIITAGICLKKMSSAESTNQDVPDPIKTLSHLGLVILQMVCSVLASVCNESQLKKKSKNEIETGKPKPISDVFAANMCLYVESIILNGIAVVVMPQALMDHSSFNSNLNTVMNSTLQQGIILTLALVGIVSSFVLCKIDSLSKSVASVSTVLFTTIFGRILFGYEITLRGSFSATLVCIGVHSYTFSNENEKGGQDTTLTVVAYSLAKTLRQLWCIPILFLLIMRADVFFGGAP